ncbi:MAG: tetratricopeptide repeat protein [Desulfovibrionaceae bacterium]|nr:tetratricopeptide repeat protein [Desulfovibrionaceae bacterium]
MRKTSFFRLFLPAILALSACLPGCSLFSGSPAPAPQAVQSAEPPSIKPEAAHFYAQALLLWEGHGETCSNPEKAIALLNSAIEKDASCAPALLLRGRAYNQLNLAESAFNDLTSSIRIAPTSDAYAWRGFVLLREGNLKAAENDINKALGIDPSSRFAHNFLGLLRLEKGDEKAACSELHTGAELGSPAWLQKAQKEGLCK